MHTYSMKRDSGKQTGMAAKESSETKLCHYNERKQLHVHHSTYYTLEFKVIKITRTACCVYPSHRETKTISPAWSISLKHTYTENALISIYPTVNACFSFKIRIIHSSTTGLSGGNHPRYSPSRSVLMEFGILCIQLPHCTVCCTVLYYTYQ